MPVPGEDTHIEARGLTKRYGTVPAVSNVDLNIARGESYALVGKNGAGKTTLLKMLVGLARPDSGTSAVCGFDISREPLRAKMHFGYVPDNPAGYEYLTGLEFLGFTGTLRGMPPDAVRERISDISRIFPVGEILSQEMRSYSRGNRQKVSILSAIMTNPDVLIIDEPIVGLDPESIGILGRLIREHCSRGGSVLFVTHILAFAAEYAVRVGCMDNGSLRDEQPVKQKKLPSHIIRMVEASV